jgi:hypothetical protein
MKITALTVIICILACIIVVRALRRAVRERRALWSAFCWINAWLFLAVFSIFPDLLKGLATATGLENHLFFVLTIAMLALAAVTFNLNSRIDRLHRDVGLAIREVALANYRIDRLGHEQKGAGASTLPASVSGPGNPAEEPISDDAVPMRKHPLDHGS